MLMKSNKLVWEVEQTGMGARVKSDVEGSIS